MEFGIGIWDLEWDLGWDLGFGIGWDGMGMGWDFMEWDLGGKYNDNDIADYLFHNPASEPINYIKDE